MLILLLYESPVDTLFETSTATDSSNSLIAFVASVSETTSATDFPIVQLDANVSTTETTSASEVSDGVLIDVSSTLETAASDDATSAQMIANISISEGNTGTGFGTDDYAAGPYGGPQTLLVSIEDASFVIEAAVNEGAGTFGTPTYGDGTYGLGPYGESSTIPFASDTEDAQIFGGRTFFIAGIEQRPLAPGIIMLPTSEDFPASYYGGDVLYGLGLYGLDPYGSPLAYVIGSSPRYSIGQVWWNGVPKTEGVDWEYVAPFTHILHILTPATIMTDVRLIYLKWDIGVRDGFKVNDYPVPFAFSGTSIIAERVPSPNQFFTVEYTSIRPGINPDTLFARYPEIVDDMLSTHTLYDGNSGFETYRPDGYQVFDLGDNQIYEWNGSIWTSIGGYPADTKFYVKRLRQIYNYTGSTVVLIYTAGDGIDPSIPEVLEYPLFGEGIGKNLFADAFLPNSQTDYPSAYMVGQRRGVYDSWLPTDI